MSNLTINCLVNAHASGTVDKSTMSQVLQVLKYIGTLRLFSITSTPNWRMSPEHTWSSVRHIDGEDDDEDDEEDDDEDDDEDNDGGDDNDLSRWTLLTALA